MQFRWEELIPGTAQGYEVRDLLARRLALVDGEKNAGILLQGFRGIERETLRVDSFGQLAVTPHPNALGKALTHKEITTDFSEALLEFITPAVRETSTALAHLDSIHRFVHSQLDGELLWNHSMPCRLPGEAYIPIAMYGNSHAGTLKHVYRRGLALRYGKRMQCIAGIHYNFSLSQELWRVLQAAENTPGSAAEYQSDGYIALIRNFHRFSWLLTYLFGASPALSSDFLSDRAHQLDRFSNDTVYLPHATSLRMSDLGYKNAIQTELAPSYESLDIYLKKLISLVNQPHPPYEKIGSRRDGAWLQLNANTLQIENEYYSTIRPKRTPENGERMIQALVRGGIEYVEVRCLDIDPFEPAGLGPETAYFLDAFLVFCALEPSPLLNQSETREYTENFSTAATMGRRPGLMLKRAGTDIQLQRWGFELLERISSVAEMLDARRLDKVHTKALGLQWRKLEEPESTPSARVLQALSDSSSSFQKLALSQSAAHADYFRSRPPATSDLARFATLRDASLAEQKHLETVQTGNFENFLEAYLTILP